MAGGLQRNVTYTEREKVLLVNLPTRKVLAPPVKCHRKFLVGRKFISAANAFHADKPDRPPEIKGPPWPCGVNPLLRGVDFMLLLLLFIHSH